MHPWLPLSTVLRHEADAASQGVSEVARSSRGFVRHYEAHKTPANMAKARVPGYNQTWNDRRNGFIARHLVQYHNNPTYRRRLALIMWAYDPE